jgi:hypothetical protein
MFRSELILVKGAPKFLAVARTMLGHNTSTGIDTKIFDSVDAQRDDIEIRFTSPIHR